MAALASDWLRHFYFSDTAERNFPKLDRNQEVNVFYQLCVFGPIGKPRWSPWSLMCWDIFDFSCETVERNSTKLDRKQDLNVPYQICFCFGVCLFVFSFVFFFLLIEKTIAAQPLSDGDIFDFFSTTAERNSTLLYRKQVLKALYQCSVFRPIWMLRWLPRTLICWYFVDFLLQPLNKIQRKLTRRKFLTSSTKFVFSCQSLSACVSLRIEVVRYTIVTLEITVATEVTIQALNEYM